MIKEELSISELAKYVGIQSQSIYLRLKDKNNIIQKYVVENSSPKRIRKEAIVEVYNKKIDLKEENTIQSTTQQEVRPADLQEIEFLKFKISTLETRIEDKEKIIVEKDKQIADKDNYISSQKFELDRKGEEIDRLMTLLSQEQALNSQKKQKIDELEMKALPTAEDNKKSWSILEIFKKKERGL